MLRKDNFAFLASLDPDILCLQETKAQGFRLPAEVSGFADYHTVFVDATRPGYSGVAILSKRKPDHVRSGMNIAEFDCEGRYVQMDFGGLSIASVYAPSGTSGEIRQAVKDRFMIAFEEQLAALSSLGRQMIVCGDLNVAHREIDVHDPKSCGRFSGFLPHERAWLERIITQHGWIDTVRAVDDRKDLYTWWTYRAGAFARNKGWRIDYQLASSALDGSVTAAKIFGEPRLSDHAAVCVDYDLAWTD